MARAERLPYDEKATKDWQEQATELLGAEMTGFWSANPEAFSWYIKQVRRCR